MKKICLLIPCYNEEATVAKVVSDFRRCLPEMEIYVYDNNSTDGTAARRSGPEPASSPNPPKAKVTSSAACFATSMPTPMSWWTETIRIRPRH